MIGANNTPIKQSGINQVGFSFQFSKDFNITNGFYKADNNSEADILNNQYNTVRLEHLYIGTLDIKYTPVYTTSELIYQIPVYLDIRNCAYNYK